MTQTVGSAKGLRAAVVGGGIGGLAAALGRHDQSFDPGGGVPGWSAAAATFAQSSAAGLSAGPGLPPGFAITSA